MLHKLTDNHLIPKPTTLSAKKSDSTASAVTLVPEPRRGHDGSHRGRVGRREERACCLARLSCTQQEHESRSATEQHTWEERISRGRAERISVVMNEDIICNKEKDISGSGPPLGGPHHPRRPHTALGPRPAAPPPPPRGPRLSHSSPGGRPAPADLLRVIVCLALSESSR